MEVTLPRLSGLTSLDSQLMLHFSTSFFFLNLRQKFYNRPFPFYQIFLHIILRFFHSYIEIPLIKTVTIIPLSVTSFCLPTVYESIPMTLI